MSFPKLRLPRRLNRRGFLIGSGALAGLTVASQWPRRSSAQRPPFASPSGRDPFQLGVASGDPLPNSVVLWTRLAPEPLQPDGGMPTRPFPVQWQIATDQNMQRIVRSGSVRARPELAHSVRVEVDGLTPNRWYWYQFKAGPKRSPVGRTRTVPPAGAPMEQLAFAFASCQQYEQGYYNAYRHMAEEDLDLVLHLGDYLYEDGPGGGFGGDGPRTHANADPLDLDGYRIRYGQYKSDADLQAAHAAFPWIVTWDDHEVANDYANANPEQYADPSPAQKERFLQRRAAAYQAYFEHMPLRPSRMPQGPDMPLFQRFTVGDLIEFSVLDTRQYRSDQACDDNGKGGGQVVTDCPERGDPNRTMLGDEQERWLLDGLANSGAQWNAIAQQYLMGSLEQKPGSAQGFWTDAWDGYTADHQRILRFLQQQRIANPVVLGGDIHSFWVTDLKPEFRNPDSPVVASEFVGTSISTDGVPYELFKQFLPENPHIKYFESRLRGYVRCTLDREQWRSDLRVVDTVKQPQSSIRTLASFAVQAGQPGAQRID